MDLHSSQNSTNLEERNYSPGSLFRDTFSERLRYLYYEYSNQKNTRARAKVAFCMETSRARGCSEEGLLAVHEHFTADALSFGGVISFQGNVLF